MIIKKETIKEIMITAMEGGIGYWACLDNTTPTWDRYYNKYKDKSTSEICAQMLADRKSLTFLDADDSSEVYVLTLNKLLHGIKIYESIYGSLSRHIDNGDFDASDADLLIQYALFGEQVFA